MAAAIAAACAGRSAVRIRTAAARVAAQAKPGGLPFRISAHRSPSPRLLRLPVVTSVCVESLLPLHGATASCLMISMLSASRGAYGWLLQGFLFMAQCYGMCDLVSQNIQPQP